MVITSSDSCRLRLGVQWEHGAMAMPRRVERRVACARRFYFIRMNTVEKGPLALFWSAIACQVQNTFIYKRYGVSKKNEQELPVVCVYT